MLWLINQSSSTQRGDLPAESKASKRLHPLDQTKAQDAIGSSKYESLDFEVKLYLYICIYIICISKYIYIYDISIFRLHTVPKALHPQRLKASPFAIKVRNPRHPTAWHRLDRLDLGPLAHGSTRNLGHFERLQSWLALLVKKSL